METRICRVCKETFPLTAEFFQPNGHNRDKTLAYFRPECKKCRSEDTKGRNSARKLAGNPETPKMGTPCELCKRTDQRLVFDHCKANLKHRGWLCNSCNKGIGLLGDTVDALENVVLYLRKNS